MSTEQTRNGDREIAQTIKAQIGASSLFMLGAETFVFGRNFIGVYLQFRIKGSRTANKLVITLNEKDLYNVHALKVVKYHTEKEVLEEDVYAEDLHSCIRRLTGLETRFPTIRRANS